MWVGRESLRINKIVKDDRLAQSGRELLVKNKKRAAALEIIGHGTEKSCRKTVILKAVEGYEAYGDMLLYYAVKNCCAYLRDNPGSDYASLCASLKGTDDREWTNLGGQLIPAGEVDRLRTDIGSGMLGTWDDIHGRYDRLWAAYPRAKQRHAFAVLCGILGAAGCPTRRQWFSALDKAVDIQEYIRDQVYHSRKKDDDNPFRQATYRTRMEMMATVGTAESNGFVKQVQKDTEAFKKTIEEIKKRG
jgi:hypothetical protein